MEENINIAGQQDVIQWREGVLYLQGEPLYIIRHVMSNDQQSDYVAVFGVDQEVYEQSKGQRVIKKVTQVGGKKFNASTALGKLGNKLEGVRSQKRKPRFETAPALFVTSVVMGVPTFHDGTSRARGFYEMTTDRINQVTGELVAGEHTGVFIPLEGDIEWGETKVSLAQLIGNASGPKEVSFYDL